MAIIQEKGKNSFTWTGLTLGKLMAIEHALLQYQSPVADDVHIEVKRAVDAQRLQLSQPS